MTILQDPKRPMQSGDGFDYAGLAFGGQLVALERAAHLRRDLAEQARMRSHPAARMLLLWRGRPLFVGANLALLPPDHPACAKGAGMELFLGLSGDAPLFACDVSNLEPEGPQPEGAAFFDPSEQHHPDLPEDHVFAELRGRMTLLSPLQAELAATARAIFEWHRSHRFCSRCGDESAPAEAGWIRCCPACSGQHFPRTDPVVIMLVTRGNKLLLGRSPQWPEGMYSTLAGFMEPGETVGAAVRREVLEETGVEVGGVNFIASQPWPFPTSLMLGCHGRALSDTITPDTNEIEDALWVSRERLMEIFAGNDGTIRPPRAGAIAGWLMREWLADRIN